MAQHGQADHFVRLAQPDAADPRTVPSGEHPQAIFGDLEAQAAAKLGGQEYVIRVPAGRHADQPVAVIQLHRDDAAGADAAEIRQLVAPHGAAGGGEHQVQVFPQAFILRQRQHGGDLVATKLRQQVDHSPALGGGGRFRQAPDLFPERFAAAAEEQHPLMGMRIEAAGHHIVPAGAGAGTAPAAAVLLAEDVECGALDEPVPGDGHHHLARFDKALIVLVRHRIHNGGHAGGGDLGPHLHQLVADHLQPARAAVQNGQ